jgi:hypothetical protein
LVTPLGVARAISPDARFGHPALRSLGVARAASPDARFGHPALRSLPASFALGILPSLAAKAGSRGTGNPSLGYRRQSRTGFSLSNVK